LRPRVEALVGIDAPGLRALKATQSLLAIRTFHGLLRMLQSDFMTHLARKVVLRDPHAVDGRSGSAAATRSARWTGWV
jgi:hypothetical protein